MREPNRSRGSFRVIICQLVGRGPRDRSWNPGPCESWACVGSSIDGNQQPTWTRHRHRKHARLRSMMAHHQQHQTSQASTAQQIGPDLLQMRFVSFGKRCATTAQGLDRKMCTYLVLLLLTLHRVCRCCCLQVGFRRFTVECRMLCTAPPAPDRPTSTSSTDNFAASQSSPFGSS